MGLITRTEDGFYRLPAFIDAHVHVESSHLTPARFGRLIAAQGTLTAICDPHEIVNVMGEAGLDFMLADAKRSPADLRFALPSCVPATPFETSGASLSAADTARLFAAHPELIALGEMMNVPGVLADDPEVLGKIAAAKAAGKQHDHHNLLVLGTDADDIRAAAAHLASLGGGQCVVLNGKVLADLPLPIAGLMSARPAADVTADIAALNAAARQAGCTLSDPFATLSFLALPVIPALKLTDRGLFACP